MEPLPALHLGAEDPWPACFDLALLEAVNDSVLSGHISYRLNIYRIEDDDCIDRR